MPRQNFDDVYANEPGDTVPDDSYSADIVGVEPGVTQKGTKWDVWCQIADGPFKGKRIKDTWYWYGGGLGRTKACISGCGVEVKKGEADYRPEQFVNRPVFINVVNKTEDYNGQKIEKCQPSFAGYHFDSERPYTPPAPKPEQTKLPESDQSVPF